MEGRIDAEEENQTKWKKHWKAKQSARSALFSTWHFILRLLWRCSSSCPSSSRCWPCRSIYHSSTSTRISPCLLYTSYPRHRYDGNENHTRQTDDNKTRRILAVSSVPRALNTGSVVFDLFFIHWDSLQFTKLLQKYDVLEKLYHILSGFATENFLQYFVVRFLSLLR